MKTNHRKLVSALVVMVLLTTLAFTYVYAFMHDDDAWDYGTRTQSTTKKCFSYFYCPVETHNATARIYFDPFWEDVANAQAARGEWALADTLYKPLYWSTEAYYSH